MMRILLLLLCSFSLASKAQNEPYPKDYFRAPMNIPLLLSGNFGELRTNHFHTGLDILTKGVEGIPIVAIADGYVSRVNTSPWGYGKVLYVDHPNGYTSVYAHLSAFNDTITSFYTGAQYKAQQYILDLYPESSKLPVKKGEVIGYSGNTGLSMGPHLHFEIRKTKTEEPINPLLFGFDVKDNIAPTLKGVRVYRFQSEREQGYCDKSHVVTGSGGNYRLKYGSQVNVSGTKDDLFGIAIHGIDRLTESPGICGIYHVKLFVDEELIFEQKTEKLSFYTNRYMNAHTDYEVFRKQRQHYHRSFKLLNNQLDIYPHAPNNGLFHLPDNEWHAIRYEVYDVAGNRSDLSFQLKRSDAGRVDAPETGTLFRADSENHLETPGFQVFMPPGCIYFDIDVDFKTLGKANGCLTSTYRLHDKDVPVQSYYELRIKADLDSSIQDKALIVRLDNGRIVSSQGGTYTSGWMVTETRTFGDFAVTTDTKAPVINPVNIYSGKNMAYNTEIAFKASDNLAGVDEFNCYIDDEWVLMEYDPKRNKFFVRFDDIDVSKGTHQLVFEVIDGVGNRAEWSGSFAR